MTTEDRLAVAIAALKEIKSLPEESYGDSWASEKALKTDDVHDICDQALCFCLPIEEVQKELVEQGIYTDNLKSWMSEKLKEVNLRGAEREAHPLFSIDPNQEAGE